MKIYSLLTVFFLNLPSHSLVTTMDVQLGQNEKLNVFTYGTLMSENVLQVVLGRVPQREDGILHNYERRPIQGQVYPAVMHAPEKLVAGVVLHDLTAEEIIILDAFEDPAYERCCLPVTLNSGDQVVARVWVRSSENVDDLDANCDWSFTEFQINHERQYVCRCKEWSSWYRRQNSASNDGS